jgi:hypothetical protein
VTGADRTLALKLLEIMPANLRGDFVYVNGTHIVSNRVALKGGVHFAKPGDALYSLRSTEARGQSARRATLSYPPTGGSGGPYIRNYSAQGVNAGSGYATLACDSSLTNGDEGYTYFNSYNATSSGSLVDAGLAVSQFNGSGPLVANAFINDEGTAVFYGPWTDENYTWPCGTPIGIMYGTIYNPGPMVVLLVGQPTDDPTAFLLPPTSSTWTHAAWDFIPAPSDLFDGGGTWSGMSSPCMSCSVAKMFTISPASSPSDTSCFGLCSLSQVPDGRWDQVVMGEMVQPCSQQTNVTATCTVEYTTNGSWYGGLNAGPGGTLATGNTVYSTNDTNRGLEGIELGRTPIVYSQGYAVPAGVFRTLLPVSSACTPDSLGYCVVSISTTVTGACNTGITGVHGEPVYIDSMQRVYEVFQQTSYLQLIETATETSTVTGPHCVNSSVVWSPGEPSLQYNDSSLP